MKLVDNIDYYHFSPQNISVIFHGRIDGFEKNNMDVVALHIRSKIECFLLNCLNSSIINKMSLQAKYVY